MTSKPISQLIEITGPASSDILPIVNSHETKKVTVENLLKSIPIPVVPTEIDTTDSPYAVTVEDQILLCDSSSGDITITMLAVASANSHITTIKNIGSGTVSVYGSGVELIETDNLLQLNPYDSVTLHPSSVQWWII